MRVARTRFLYILLTCFLLFGQFVPQAAAQTDNSAGTLGVAQMVLAQDKNVKDGSILSTSPKGAILSNTPYDSQVAGVVSRDASIILNSADSDNSVPVVSSGSVYILVSTQKGPIKKGDFITTSTIAGVGVKATEAGYVLGTAMEDYDNPDPKQTGLIAANLDMHYFNSKPSFPGSLSDIFKFALLPTKDAPSPIFKYTVAAIVVLGSFVLAFLSFGRTAAKGVEALGRNPAASRIIHLGIIFNVTIVVVIVLTGLAVAFMILRL
jgi:hypothetical protein